MRWFIVFLIVANVILFFWVQQESRPRPADVRLPPPDVGRLRLLTEMRSSAAAEGVESAGRPGASSNPGPAAGAVASPDAEPVLAPAQADSRAQTPTQSVPPAQVADSIDTGVADPETAVVADQVAPVAKEAAVTLRGVSDIERRDTGPAASTAAGEEHAVAIVPLCARVGPFPPDDADDLISNLPPNIVLLSDVAEEYTSVERYYVIIPPLPSRAEGKKKMKELADAGVTDTWLFLSGAYRNGISLGFFSRKGGARKRAANVAKKGFNAEIKEQTSVSERRWLLLKDRDGVDPGQSLPLPSGILAEMQRCP